jgi:hypothetical protein
MLPHQEIPELTAARIIQNLMETRGGDRIEVVSALLAWATTLLRNAPQDVRVEAARLMVANACWLAPHERFDAETLRLLRERASH